MKDVYIYYVMSWTQLTWLNSLLFLKQLFQLLQGEYEESLKRKQRQNEYLSHQMKDIQTLTEDARVIDRKLRALRNIIAVKSHPATVKKIFFQGYTPGEKIDFRGTIHVFLPHLPLTLKVLISVAADDRLSFFCIFAELIRLNISCYSPAYSREMPSLIFSETE